jgi:hypothetical protein
MQSFITEGKFRTLLLPVFKMLSVDKNATEHFSKFLRLLGQLYNIGALYHHQNPEKEYPLLNLSKSGLSKNDLSSFIKLLRVLYCDNYSHLKRIKSLNSLNVGHYLQDLDLSQNDLTYTCRLWRAIKPSVCQRLAVWLSDQHCLLRSLNLKDNPQIGGCSEFQEARFAWSSDIYRIIMGLHIGKNNRLRMLNIANTGTNTVDFRALMLMLGQNSGLMNVDVSWNSAISVEAEQDYHTMLETRYQNNYHALALNLRKTGLSALPNAYAADPADSVFKAEMEYWLEKQYLKCLGQGLFAGYKLEKHSVVELDYWIKFLKAFMSIGNGILEVLVPGYHLVTLASKVVGFVGSVLIDTENFKAILKAVAHIWEILKHIYELIKGTSELATKSQEKVEKLRKLRKELQNRDDAGNEHKILQRQCKEIAILFQQDPLLKNRIAHTLSHHYYDIVSRLSIDEVVTLAQALELPLGMFFMSIALNAYQHTDEITEAFLDFLQSATLPSFHTLKFSPLKKRGYILHHDRSFTDIFDINRASAERLARVDPQEDDPDSDHCYANLDFLKAFAHIQGINLVIWTRDENEKLFSFEDNAPPNRSSEHKRIDLIVDNNHYFNQVTFEGYAEVGPTRAELPIPKLTTTQKELLESQEVWVKDLLQRSGYVCLDSNGNEIRFDLQIKLQTQDKKSWTSTDHALFGCRRASPKMLETISLMIAEYRKIIDLRGRILEDKIRLPYKDVLYGIEPLTSTSKTPLGGACWGFVSPINPHSHFEKTHNMIKPAVIEALSSWSSFAIFLRDQKWVPYELFYLSEDEFLSINSDLKELYDRQKCQEPDLEIYWDRIRRYADNPNMLKEYYCFLDMNLRRDGLHNGWPHPGILRAKSEIASYQLEFYRLTEEGEIVSHPKYQNILPKESKETIQLLYYDDYRFQWLRTWGPMDKLKDIPFRWSCDNAMVSRCGNFKVSQQTLLNLMNIGELKAITMQYDEELKDKVEKLKGEVNEHEVLLLDHEERITNLEEIKGEIAAVGSRENERIIKLETELEHCSNENIDLKEELKVTQEKLEVTSTKLEKANKKIGKLAQGLINAKEIADVAYQQVQGLEARLNEFIPQRNVANPPIRNNNNYDPPQAAAPNNPPEVNREEENPGAGQEIFNLKENRDHEDHPGPGV